MRISLIAVCLALLFAGCGSRDVSSNQLAAVGFLSDAARAELQLPAKGELTLAMDADRAKARSLDPEVSRTVGTFLQTRNVSWQIVAARPIGDYILLWITFPKIADGGVDLIYSAETKTIVGEFLGGYRG